MIAGFLLILQRGHSFPSLPFLKTDGLTGPPKHADAQLQDEYADNQLHCATQLVSIFRAAVSHVAFLL